MPKKPTISPKPIPAADWQEGRDMLATLYDHGRRFLLAQVLLGWWLGDKKKALGFTHGGSRTNSSGHDGHLNSRTWEEWVKEELDLPRRTADRFIKTHEGAKAKLKRLGGYSKAYALLETRPGEVSAEDQTKLKKQLISVTDGETQKNLLTELKLVKKTPKPPGPNGEGEEEDLTAEQLAFIFVTPVVSQLAELRLNKDLSLYLSALPLQGDEDTNNPGLLDIQDHLKSMLGEIETTLEEKKQ